ncbi:hypothetical protein GW758_00865 [Candidatus Falkowbacteria bacterium]|nr:hypothetical protein [Candidatus Falkowbacteria bacterium]
MLQEKVFTIDEPIIKKLEEKEDLEVNEEMSEDLVYLIGDLRFLKNKDEQINNPEEYKHRLESTLEHISDFFKKNGGKEEDVSSIYRNYLSKNGKPLIVRREDPEKVVRLIENEDIDLSFDPKVVADRGDKYANCAIWPHGVNPTAGMQNAFLEGRGMAGPLVTMMASRQNSQHNLIEDPKDKMLNTGNINRESVRIVSGQIKKEDLEFIIVRLPKKFLSPEKLSEEEKNNNLKEVFRGFTFKNKN